VIMASATVAVGSICVVVVVVVVGRSEPGWRRCVVVHLSRGCCVFLVGRWWFSEWEIPCIIGSGHVVFLCY